MKVDLTDNFVKKIKNPERDQEFYRDNKFSGFALRVTRNGIKTFVLFYRQFGRKRMLKIGRFGELNCSNARNIALDKKYQVLKGEDPKREHENFILFKDFTKEFLEVNKNNYRPKTLQYYNFLLKNYILPKFGDKYINEIKKSDIEKFHKRLGSRKITANRALQLLSAIFVKAENFDIITKSPVKGVKKFQEDKKERFLDDDEKERLMTFLNKDDKIQSYIIKLLLLTGSRRGEVLNMKWGDLDLKKGVWLKEAASTKQKKKSLIPLNDEVITIFNQLKKIKGDNGDDLEVGKNYIFFNKKTQKPIKDIKNYWKTLKKETKIDNLRIHDLRHNFASILINKGVGIEIIGKLLGHSSIKTTQRYAHLMHDSLRKATDKIDFS